MRTRRSILRSRDESSDRIPREEAQLGTQPTTSLTRNENGLFGQLRTKLTLEADRRNFPVAQLDTKFNSELHRLKKQNLQLKRGRTHRPPVEANAAPCHSTDTLFSGSGGSVRSFPESREYPSTSAVDSSSFAHPLNTLSLLPKPRRLNVLETLVRAFPITIPIEEFVNFVDAKGHPDLTDDMKRYFVDRKNQHRAEFERCVNVFKSERPWEPKWFTHFLGRLLASTKARPSFYQYMFDLRQRKEESKVLQIWKNMSAFLKWTIFAISLGMYFVMLCFLIEMNGDEGVNMTVPITLIITIIINQLLVNMNLIEFYKIKFRKPQS